MLVAELQQKDIKQIYLKGEDEEEVLDILRLTCIEASIHLNERPNGVVIKVEGQDYSVVTW